MRRLITERNLVGVLFVMVIITFSFAERDTKKIEHLYIGVNLHAPSLNTFVEFKVKNTDQTPSLILPSKISK